ncbi:MAG TPA: hypothetical protein VFH31_04765 [Pyrinomonadaceae bacterium]|nr:hypothetical protein [Pyrinomonadaceae bacterium]
MSGAGFQNEHKWTWGLRLLSNQIPRAAVRTTITYRFHRRLTAGIEFNPRADEVAPIANLLVLTETKRRPALMLGTSTDRIGTPSGQSFYATLSKNMRRETGLPIAPYVGASFGTFDNRLRPIGGLNVFLNEKFSIVVTYNGVNVHPLLSFTHKRHTLSLVMVKGRDPGMSYSVTF